MAANLTTMDVKRDPAVVVAAVQALALDCSRLLESLQEINRGDKEPLYKCQNMCKQCLSEKATSSVETKLQQYAQAMLDFTFYTESILTDEEFPQERCQSQVEKLLKQLEIPLELAQKVLPQKQVADILGVEIYECVRWRQGALLYMLCSIINGDDNRRERNKDSFLQNILKGVEYLTGMLSIQRSKNANFSCNDEQTYNLVKEGIYSDTHVLNLMYTGEMCYWYLQNMNQNAESNSKDSVSLAMKGKAALQTYLRLTEGPLKSCGWSSDRAIQLLNTPYFS